MLLAPSFWNRPGRQRGQVWNGTTGASRAPGPLYGAGASPGAGVGAGRGGSRGSWGSDPISSHLCAAPPHSHTHANTHKCTRKYVHSDTHVHTYIYTHMCNALTHRHAHLQVHKLAHAQPFRAIFDIPLPQGRMSTRVLMSSASCVSSALTSALLQDPSPTLTSTVPHPRRLRPIVPPCRNPEKGWQSIPHFSPLQDGAQWRNGREGGGARAVLTPSVWYLTTGPRWKSLGVVFADSRGINAPTRPTTSSRRHSQGRGAGGEGRVLETSSSMALGGPCPGV